MLSNVFLGFSLLGAEWVLYLLVGLSVLSITLIFERALYYRTASREIDAFRRRIREAGETGRWDEALRASEALAQTQTGSIDAAVATALLRHTRTGTAKSSTNVLAEISRDAMMRTRLGWDRNLSILATIGNNAPFVGLFGTVLGIIKAFHDLSQQAGAGAQTVSSGISEALVATAVGILVAIPAVVAFNLFQRKVRSAVSEAEALKSFLIGKLSG